MIYLVLQDTQGQEGQTGGWGEAVTTREVLKDWDGEEGRAQGTSGGNPWGLFMLALEASFVPSQQVGKEQRQMALGEQQPGTGRTKEDEQGHLLRAMHTEPRA